MKSSVNKRKVPEQQDMAGTAGMDTSVLLEMDAAYVQSKTELINRFLKDQIDLNRVFAEFALNDDDNNSNTATGDRKLMGGAHHIEEIDHRLSGACTPLVITDLEDGVDSMENASIVSACHSSSGSEAERQSVIREEDYQNRTQQKPSQTLFPREPSDNYFPKHTELSAVKGAYAKKPGKKVLTKKNVRPSTCLGYRQMSSSHSVWSIGDKQNTFSDQATCSAFHGLQSKHSPPSRFNSKSVIPGIPRNSSPSRQLDPKTSPAQLSPRFSPTQTLYDQCQNNNYKHGYNQNQRTPLNQSTKTMRRSVSSETPWNYSYADSTINNSTQGKLKDFIPLELHHYPNGKVDNSILMSTQRSNTFHMMDSNLRSQTPTQYTVVKLPPLDNKGSLPGNPSAIINTPT